MKEKEDKKKTKFKEYDMFFMQFGFKDDKRIKKIKKSVNLNSFNETKNELNCLSDLDLYNSNSSVIEFYEKHLKNKQKKR